MSRAWMPFYVGDYLADTKHLSTVEHGAYLLLIMHYWQRGSLPTDDDRLARIAGLDDMQWQCVRIAIAPFFTKSWKHIRIEKELQKAAEKSEKASKSASNRWNKDKKSIMRTHSEGNANAYANGMLSQSQSHIVISPTDLSAEGSADEPPPKFSRKPNPEKSRLLTEVGERWNDLASSYGLPCIQTIDGGRERACLARAKELTKTYDYPNAETGFDELFGKIRASSFLRGDAKPRNGGGAFRATFDWVMAPSNFRKIMENTYG